MQSYNTRTLYIEKSQQNYKNKSSIKKIQRKHTKNCGQLYYKKSGADIYDCTIVLFLLLLILMFLLSKCHSRPRICSRSWAETRTR